MTTSEILDRAADLCAKGWTQRVLGRDKDGYGLGSDDLWRATCFCASGAIIKAGGGNDNLSALGALSRVIGSVIVPTWNDAPGRTQAEVVEALRKAAALAREQGE